MSEKENIHLNNQKVCSFCNGEFLYEKSEVISIKMCKNCKYPVEIGFKSGKKGWDILEFGIMPDPDRISGYLIYRGINR